VAIVNKISSGTTLCGYVKKLSGHCPNKVPVLVKLFARCYVYIYGIRVIHCGFGIMTG